MPIRARTRRICVSSRPGPTSDRAAGPEVVRHSRTNARYLDQGTRPPADPTTPYRIAPIATADANPTAISSTEPAVTAAERLIRGLIRLRDQFRPDLIEGSPRSLTRPNRPADHQQPNPQPAHRPQLHPTRGEHAFRLAPLAGISNRDLVGGGDCARDGRGHAHTLAPRRRRSNEQVAPPHHTKDRAAHLGLIGSVSRRAGQRA